MADLIIYGASDDLIEIEGVIRDELNPPYGKPAVVTIKVDDAVWTLVPIEYGDEGIWRIQPPRDVANTFTRARGEDEDRDEHGCPGYSDKVAIDVGDIEARRFVISLAEED